MRAPGPGKEMLRIAGDFAAAGDWPQARSLCAEFMRAQPADPEALHLMGCIASGDGNLALAATYLRQALELGPRLAGWFRDLGIVLVAAERWDDAAGALARCLAIDPKNKPALSPYALALRQCGNLKAALTAYDQLLATDPGSSEGWFGAAQCLSDLGLVQEAAERARRGLQLDYEGPEGHELLAEIYGRLHEYEKQLSHCLEVVRLRPGEPAAKGRCAIAWYLLGETERSISLFREAIEAGDNPNLHTVFLSVLLHHAGSPPDVVAEEHRRWGRRYTPIGANNHIFTNSRDAKRRLKLGYLVSEGSSSPLMYFLKPILRHHDRSGFDVTLYYTDRSIGDCRERLALSPTEAREAVDLTPAALTEQFRRDGVDILIDVCGHYGANLPVSGNGAAPVQVSYPSYPATTGVPRMDYIFTDRWTCAPGQESQYLESAFQLDSGYIVYEPPFRPRVGPLPAASNGFVTFGVFQRPAKLNARVWDLIAEVLHRVPNSRILFHHASADLHHEGSTSRQRFLAALESRGIPGDRSRFLGNLSVRRHLAAISTVDIALDSFPYTGQTTTCECLWMGVPVVTLAGQTHVSRVSAGIISRVGLEEYVAATPEEYVGIAVRTSGEPAALAELRKGLRRRFRSSTVLDGEPVIREMEDAYRRMWQRWVDSQVGQAGPA